MGSELTGEFLVAGLVWYIVYLLSTTCHEAAHAWAAKMGGDLTAFHGGQVSLDPLPHIRREPFGMVVFPILTYVMNGWMMGWASAPYDPYWAQRYPRRAAWMSLAGPAANFALVLIAAILIRVGMGMGALQFTLSDSFSMQQLVQATHPGIASGVATFLSLLFSLNVLLGCFNLLPLPPMDGFSVVGLFLNEEMGRKYQEFGWSIRSYSFIGMLLAWRLFDYLFAPIFGVALRLLGTV